jgi:uncharacterized iron-regulated membrane protein
MAAAATKNSWLFIHRWFGIVTAAFLFLAAITGTVLTFRASLDRWVNGDLLVYQGDAEDRLPVIELVSRFEAAHPELQLVGFPLNPGTDDNLAVSVAPKPGGAEVTEREMFLDPATGDVVGARSTEPGFTGRQIVPLLLEFHFNLLAGDAGRIFMGFMALGWLVSAFVGLYLTLPRKGPFLKNWAPVWTYSPKRSFARQMLDLHRASALWLYPLLIALAFTSVAINFFSEFWDPFSTWVSPLKRTLFNLDAPFPDGAVPQLSYGDALALAQHQASQAGMTWQTATMLYYPNWDLYGVTFSDNGTLNYKALGPIYYYFSGANGAFVHEVNPYTDSAGLVMIRMIYPIHSGETAGPFGVFVVAVLGIATAQQCITGIWVWLKKRGPRMAAKKASRASLA